MFRDLPDQSDATIDRSRRDLSIGGIRLVWEVREGGDKVDFGQNLGKKWIEI